ncbi:recombinase family protein [Lactiplantibacillus plantarum]|uniref:recombinase family protein n=1 Tax=Lactiplantibacillus plantarum TaxID=1590 RepID=UPI0015D4CE47|nr:recombinase family protein [Lactiplantibacillus plantarum]
MMKDSLALAYYRVSSKKQGDRWSLTAQREAVQKEASRKSYFIQVECQDVQSGGSMDRAGLRQIIAEVETGRYKYLLVWRLNRLTRSLADFLKMTAICQENDTQIVSLMEPVQEDAIGRLQQQIYVMFGEWQLGVLKDNQKMAYQQKMNEGHLLSSSVPLGYEYVAGQVRVVAAQSKIVQYLYAEYSLGKLGYRKLAARIQQKFDYALTPNGVAKILRNRAYTGVLENKYGRQVNLFPRIIEDRQFEHVQRIRQSRQVIKKHASNAYLRHKIVCPVCGGSLTPIHMIRGHRQYDYWYCAHSVCSGIRINEVDLLAQLDAHLMTLIDNHLRERLLEEIRRRSVMKPMVSQVVDQTKLFQQFETGELASEELAEQLAQAKVIQQQVTANQATQKQLELRVRVLLSKLDQTSTEGLLAGLDIDHIEINALKQVTGLFIQSVPKINLFKLGDAET